MKPSHLHSLIVLGCEVVSVLIWVFSVLLYMYIYVCMYMYVCIYIYICIYTYTYVYISVSFKVTYLFYKTYVYISVFYKATYLFYKTYVYISVFYKVTSLFYKEMTSVLNPVTSPTILRQCYNNIITMYCSVSPYFSEGHIKSKQFHCHMKGMWWRCTSTGSIPLFIPNHSFRMWWSLYFTSATILGNVVFRRALGEECCLHQIWNSFAFVYFHISHIYIYIYISHKS